MFDSQDELDQALKNLLERNLISMTWDSEKEELAFFMSHEQKRVYDIQYPRVEPPTWEGSSLWSH